MFTKVASVIYWRCDTENVLHGLFCKASLDLIFYETITLEVMYNKLQYTRQNIQISLHYTITIRSGHSTNCAK